MKVRELLELTQTKKLADIAKERLDFGEKKAVEVLKEAGCYHISGKRGWHFDGDEAVLERSIYSFVPPSKKKGIAKPTADKTSVNNRGKTGFERASSEVATSIERVFNTSTSTSADNRSSEKTGDGKGAGVGVSVSTGIQDRTDEDILDRLFEGLPAGNDKKEVSFYLTHDVIEVINRAKKGNRSDLVNEALRKVFREKGWM